jgi:hypothetical protein
MQIWRAGEQLILDVEGLDLPDVSAARREAIKSAREILAAAICPTVLSPPETACSSASDNSPTLSVLKALASAGCTHRIGRRTKVS